MFSIFKELSVGVAYRAKICINEDRKKFPRLLCRGISSMPAPSSAYPNSHFENFSTLMFLKDGTCLLSSLMLYIFYEVSRPISLKYTSNTDFSFDLKRTLNTSFPKVKGYSLQELIFFQCPLSWWMASAFIIPKPETLTSPSLSPWIHIKSSLSLDDFMI